MTVWDFATPEHMFDEPRPPVNSEDRPGL